MIQQDLSHHIEIKKSDRMMLDTQLNAYESIKQSMGRMHSIIYFIIQKHPHSSNADICSLLDRYHPRSNGQPWKICSVTGRVKELREMHKVIITGNKTDPFTNRPVKTWGAI